MNIDVKFGLHGPDQPDPRDRLHAGVDGELEPINLLDVFGRPKIRNQGQTNRCTGFGGAVLLEMVARKIGFSTTLSANDLYNWIRPDPNVDSGGSARAAALALVKQGACAHSDWPDDRPFNQPPTKPVDPRRRFTIPSVERITDVDILLTTLSVERLPVGCGSRMHRDATSQAVRTGLFPKFRESDPFTGYHWECIVGWRYNRAGDKEFLKLGSWGSSVGDLVNPGCFWIPEHYITDRVVTDMWTVGHETY